MKLEEQRQEERLKAMTEEERKAHNEQLEKEKQEADELKKGDNPVSEQVR